MLKKPLSQYPHSETIFPNQRIDFQCEFLANPAISEARLMHSNGVYQRYIYSDDDNIVTDNLVTKISFPIDYENSYNVQIDNSTYKRYGESSSKEYFSIKNGSHREWSMRIYENTGEELNSNYIPTSWIGYGIFQSDASTNTYKIPFYENIYFENLVGGENAAYKQYYIYYDEKAQYYIKIQGKYYKITDYKCYSGDTLNSSTDFDSYGRPIYAYITLDGDNLPTVSSGEEFALYCNYIDTDTYYFDLHARAQISLYENFNADDKSLLEHQFYIDKSDITMNADKIYTGQTRGDWIEETALLSDDVMAVSETTENKGESLDSPLTINYSNLNLSAKYSQAEGYGVSRYNIILEQINSDGTLNVINTTGNIYSPVINWKYDEFLNNRRYVLTLAIVDNIGVTTTKKIYIVTNFKESSPPTNLEIKPYDKHCSLIIDFSQMHSITPTVAIDNAYQFAEIDKNGEEISDELQIETISEDDEILVLSENDNNETYYTCHIDKGNSFTYDNLDGKDSLSFEDYTAYTIFKIDRDYTGKIFEVTDDFGELFVLSWDGVCFKGSVTDTLYNLKNNEDVFVYCPYDPYEEKEQYWSKYSSNIEEKQNILEEKMTNSEIDCSVPYLYLDSLNINFESLYLHTESITSEFWWMVIVDTSAKCIYLKNISEEDSDLISLSFNRR